MLGKLLKYEFLATGRQILPAYGAVVIFAVLNRILSELGGGINAFMSGFQSNWAIAATGLLLFFYGLAVFAIALLTIVLIIRRFYTNLFKDEGYLSHTLPVSTDSLIWAKLIPAACWSVLSIIVVSLSFAIVFSAAWSGAAASSYAQPFIWTWTTIGAMLPSIVSILWGVLRGIAALLTGILAFYSALSIGQLAKRHKILLAIGAFLGMSFVFSLLSDLTSFVGAGAFLVFAPLGEAFFLITTLIQAGTYYFITRFVLKNKLNLE